MDNDKRIPDEENRINDTENAEKLSADGNDIKKAKRARLITVALALAITIISVATIPTFAWFYGYKNMAAYAPLDAPKALFIGTGRKEDVKYLYLKEIDVTKSTYKDYVISVSGEGITRYSIQMGYTNNNQFNYKLFFASEKTQSDLDLMDAGAKSDWLEGAIAYEPYDGTRGEAYYKIDDSTSYSAYSVVAEEITYVPAAEADGEVKGSVKNSAAGDEILAEPSGVYHDSTYSAYTTVQKYAEPIYWQTTNAILTPHTTASFTQYFILRVEWEAVRDANSRETDIICIAAKAG